MTSPSAVSDPPAWSSCGRREEAPARSSSACRGRIVEPYQECLAHLDAIDRRDYLSLLGAGADVDHRGTAFSPELLDELSAAVAADTGQPAYGNADFREATFGGSTASFEGVTFSRADFGDAAFLGNVTFKRAVFSGEATFCGASFRRPADFATAHFGGSADFRQATFTGKVAFNGAAFARSAHFDDITSVIQTEFEGASFAESAAFRGAKFSGEGSFFEGCRFAGEADFGRSQFTGQVDFTDAHFSGKTAFDGATYSGRVSFARSTFGGQANFRHAEFAQGADFGRVAFLNDLDLCGTTFTGAADFDRAEFEGVSMVGPLICMATLNLSGAVFSLPVTVLGAARNVTCERTRWMATALLRLRYAVVDLTDAVAEYPVSLVTHTRAFTDARTRVPLREPFGQRRTDHRVAVRSLSGVDAAQVCLIDVDLSGCRFAGAVHLDQLSLKGRCTFADPPSGWRWSPWPARWTPRRTLVEEHRWRRGAGRREWSGAGGGESILGPATLTAQYRELRKAFEDGKNEPGAADFYYGEMEMRRNDRSTPQGERWLLALYWAVSGYGLRVSRSLGWLLAAMATTVLLMMLWGLAGNEPKPLTSGTQAAPGQKILLRTESPAPANPRGPLVGRLTTDRFEKSLRTVVNSVVFRSGGQDLTTAGTYVEMAARIGEPVLLGLSVLALRGRVKR
ncbi:pentapeptide repeat-containing protein [Streptomyces sp. NPDC060322]|uniref:pentapeptide repeat-containing protein n=1 Tax=Streptomyces sp. NPDC060322 TaxID=3347097 RepID=UPI0036665A78